jgi:hypothetical protein
MVFIGKDQVKAFFYGAAGKNRFALVGLCMLAN